MWVEEGFEAIKQQRYDEACGFDRAIALMPDGPVLYWCKGMALYVAGRKKEANECFMMGEKLQNKE